MRDDTQELARLHRVKQTHSPAGLPLGAEMVSFFKQSVQKRQTRLARIAECWAVLVPETLSDHCAFEGLNRGTLTVLVDSASHLYELKQLLLAGLQDQLMIVCKATGLKKINLKPGRWYEGDGPTDDRRVQFPR